MELQELISKYNLNPNLCWDKVEPHSQEWFDYRLNGVGGSEAAAIKGLSPYKSSLEVFYEKIGEKSTWQEENEPIFWGKELEDNVREVWQYYDGDHQSYIKNYRDGKKIRSVEKIDGYFYSSDRPYVFGQPDGIIPPGNVNLATGEPLDKAGILECKTISHFEAKKWENEVPSSYIAQVTLYMAIFGVEYAEICLLKDGRYLDVKVVELSEIFRDSLYRDIDDFWNNKVVPAKKIVSNRDNAYKANKMEDAEAYEGELHRLEPEPDGSESYKKFMSESALAETTEQEGDAEEYSLAQKELMLKELRKVVEEHINYHGNWMRKICKDLRVERISFGKEGYFQLKTQKNAKNPVLKNNVKPDFDKEELKEKADKAVKEILK